MKKNESWAEFMNRARKNGVSPTRQEQWDREEQDKKKVLLEEGYAYFSKECIDFYGISTLQKMTGINNIEEFPNGFNSVKKESTGKR